MSDYIKRDLLYERLTKAWDTMDSEDFEKEVFKAIKEEPSADIVEVVRCKDCKYASDSVYTHCPYVTWYNGKDDFCSRGERKDNE